MVAARDRPCDTEATQPARKRQCNRRESTVTCSTGCPRDAAEQFLLHLNLAGMASAEQPVGQHAWRCLSDFNVRLIAPRLAFLRQTLYEPRSLRIVPGMPGHRRQHHCMAAVVTLNGCIRWLVPVRGLYRMCSALVLQVLMRRHAGQLRDTALSGYLSLTRVGIFFSCAGQVEVAASLQLVNSHVLTAHLLVAAEHSLVHTHSSWSTTCRRARLQCLPGCWRWRALASTLDSHGRYMCT